MGLSPVLAAVLWHPASEPESIPCLEGPRALAVRRSVPTSAFHDIARFNPRVSVARDQRSGIEIDADSNGLVAVHRPVRACDDGALHPAGRVLRFGARCRETRKRRKQHAG